MYGTFFYVKALQNTLFSLPILDSRFGGSHLKSHPKTSRPLSKKHPMHVVLKSHMARGKHSMLLRARSIEKHVHKQATQHGVKILGFVNVGNHLHLLIKLSNRQSLARFLRALCGVIAKEMHSIIEIGEKKGVEKKSGIDEFEKPSLPKGKSYWQGRPFSRVIQGLKDLIGTQKYLFLNELEVFGVSKAQGRSLLLEIKHRLDDLGPLKI